METFEGKANVKTVNGQAPDSGGNVTVTIPIAVAAGTVIAYAGNTIPSGYLICNGAAISRTTYAALFAAIGATYGAGDGSTTFNLPDLTDRFVQGSNNPGTIKAAGLPNISGVAKVAYGENNKTENTGALQTKIYTTGSASGRQDGGSGSDGEPIQSATITFNANKSNNIYGNSTTVQPPAITMRYIIKY